MPKTAPKSLCRRQPDEGEQEAEGQRGGTSVCFLLPPNLARLLSRCGISAVDPLSDLTSKQRGQGLVDPALGEGPGCWYPLLWLKGLGKILQLRGILGTSTVK